jgi:hypothetical protein
MKRITPLLLVIVAGSAQAGPEGVFNPLAMFNPMANPMAGYGSPFGGYGSSFGGYGSPYGGGFGGGYGNTMSNLNALSALASLGMVASPLAPTMLNPTGMGQFGYPAVQMAPNLMSYGHYNQYGGGLFGGNPYLQRGLPNPLAPPAFSPSVPTLPFSPSQGTLPLPFGAPSQASMPSLPFMASPAPVPSAGLMPGLSPMLPSAPSSQASPWSPMPARRGP